MNHSTEKYHVWIIIIVGLLLFGSHLGILPINIMEARNFITAREMITDDHWILTTMNDLPRYEKPPLPTWLTACSALIFGMEHTAALRIPAVIITVVLLLAAYRFCCRALELSKQQSFVNTLILATSFYILLSGRNGQWDIFTHGFMLAGIYYCFNLFEKTKKHYRNAVLAGLFIGLSFMSKGPVSLFALFLPFVISYGIVFRFKSLKSKLLALLLLLGIAGVLSAWWPYYIYLFDGDAAQAIADKEAAAWTNRNVRPFYYYWSFFTQSGLWTLPAFIGLLYPYMKSRVSNLKVYRFTLLWTLITIVLLSLIPEKKSRYLLPVLIPLAFNTGFYIEFIMRSFSTLSLKERLPVYLNFGLIALVGLAIPVVIFLQFPNLLTSAMGYVILTSIVGTGSAFLLLKNLIQKKIQQVFLTTIAFVVGLIIFAFPLSAAIKTNKDYKEVNTLQEWQEQQKLPIFDLINSAPELVWDFGKPIQTLYKSELVINYPNEYRFGLLVQPKSHELLKKHFGAYTISLVSRFDHNLMNSNEKGYKNRLSRDFYILTKK